MSQTSPHNDSTERDEPPNGQNQTVEDVSPATNTADEPVLAKIVAELKELKQPRQQEKEEFSRLMADQEERLRKELKQ